MIMKPSIIMVMIADPACLTVTKQPAMVEQEKKPINTNYAFDKKPFNCDTISLTNTNKMCCVFDSV